MTIENVAKACNGRIVCDEATLSQIREKTINGVVTDNRKVEKDYVFVPIVGNRVDGHDFIPKAIEDGALFTLSEKELEDPAGPYVLVEKSEQALKDIAAFYRSQLNIPIIGVIGSVGKTSTKEMVSSVLSQKFNVQKTQGNLNNEIGLPLTILSITDEHEAAVVEMGISDFGEMHRLGTIAKPNVVVITNIGQVHLEQLHDRDGVFKAKTEVFEHLADDATVIINTDDDKLAEIGEIPGARVIRFGTGDQFVRASDVEQKDMSGVSAKIFVGDESCDIFIPIPGEHNIYHALAATAVGLVLGIETDSIKVGIENAATIAGRSNFIRLKDGIVVIDDCYNASPISVKAALDLLSKAPARKIAVLGDMGELGKNEKALHAEVGEHLATLPIDMLYTAGTLTRALCEAVEKSDSKCEVHPFDTIDAMMTALVCEVKPRDTVLVKASHFMEFSKVVETLEANL